MSIWLLMYLFLWKQYFMQYSSKIHFPNLPDPIYKSNCPLNLMPVRASLDSKNCSQVFTITGNASLTSLWRNDHLYMAELFYFSHNESFWTWTAWLWSCQSISTWFKSGLWLSNSKTFFLFFEQFRGGLLVCFGSLSLCIAQLLLSFREWTDGWRFSFRVFC